MTCVHDEGRNVDLEEADIGARDERVREPGLVQRALVIPSDAIVSWYSVAKRRRVDSVVQNLGFSWSSLRLIRVVF